MSNPPESFPITPSFIELKAVDEMADNLIAYIHECRMNAADNVCSEILSMFNDTDPSITGIYFGRKPDNPNRTDIFICRGEDHTAIEQEEGDIGPCALRDFKAPLSIAGDTLIDEHEDCCPGFEINLPELPEDQNEEENI